MALRERCDAPTVASVWHAGTGSAIEDALLTWPPDVLALGEMILERSNAYRFALSHCLGRAA